MENIDQSNSKKLSKCRTLCWYVT